MPLTNGLTMWTSKRPALNVAGLGTLIGWWRAWPNELINQSARRFTASSTQYFIHSNPTTFNIGTNDFSGGAFVYLDSLSAVRMVMTRGNTGGTGWHRLYVNTNGTVVFDFQPAGSAARTLTTTETIGTGAWHSLLWTCDRDGLLKLYIDGVASVVTLDASTSPGSMTPTITNTFAIGAQSSGTLPMDGRICKAFFVPNVALSQDLIDEHFSSGNSVNYAELSPEFLAALGANGSYWNMGEVSGNVIDQHVNEVDLTAVNNPILSAGPGEAANPADLGTVKSWLDRSGNGNDWIQATATFNPVFRKGIVNGQGVVRTDGVNDYLAQAVLPVMGSNNSIYLVCTKSAGSDGFLYANHSPGPAIRSEFSGVDYEWSNSADLESIASGTTGFHVVGLRQSDGMSLKIDFDGTEVVDTTPSGALATSAFSRVAAIGSGANAAGADFAEIIHYSDVLSDENHAALQAYLMRQYGL